MPKKRKRKGVEPKESFWKSPRERAYDNAEIEDDDDKEDFNTKRELKKNRIETPRI